MPYYKYRVTQPKKITLNIGKILHEAWQGMNGVKAKLWFVAGIWLLLTLFISLPLMNQALSNTQTIRQMTNKRQTISQHTTHQLQASPNHTSLQPNMPFTSSIHDTSTRHEFDETLATNNTTLTKIPTQPVTTKTRQHTKKNPAMRTGLRLAYALNIFMITLGFLGWYFIPCLVSIAYQHIFSYNPAQIKSFISLRTGGRIIVATLIIAIIRVAIKYLLYAVLGHMGFLLAHLFDLLIDAFCTFVYGLLVFTPTTILQSFYLSIQAVKINFLVIILLGIIAYGLFFLGSLIIIGIIWMLPFVFILNAVAFKQAFNLEEIADDVYPQER